MKVKNNKYAKSIFKVIEVKKTNIYNEKDEIKCKILKGVYDIVQGDEVLLINYEKSINSCEYYVNNDILYLKHYNTEIKANDVLTITFNDKKLENLLYHIYSKERIERYTNFNIYEKINNIVTITNDLYSFFPTINKLEEKDLIRINKYVLEWNKLFKNYNNFFKLKTFEDQIIKSDLNYNILGIYNNLKDKEELIYEFSILKKNNVNIKEKFEKIEKKIKNLIKKINKELNNLFILSETKK